MAMALTQAASASHSNLLEELLRWFASLASLHTRVDITDTSQSDRIGGNH